MKLIEDEKILSKLISEITDDPPIINIGTPAFKQILDDHEKARLCDELCKILINHCGEDGDNEGAVDTLNRISEKARKWDSWPEVREILRNQKLRELIEKKIRNLPGQIECAISPSWKQDYELLLIEFKSLSEDSKK